MKRKSGLVSDRPSAAAKPQQRFDDERLQHGQIEARHEQHLLDAHFLPMMRHRLDLRMQHRMIDEALDAMRARPAAATARRA